MKDPRVQKLAHMLINYSTELKAGEKVLIEVTGYHTEIVSALVEEAYKVGALPFVQVNHQSIQRALIAGATDEQLAFLAKHDAERMRNMQAYIGIRGDNNLYELSDVPAAQMQKYLSLYSKEVHGKIRVPQTRWVVLRYPNDSMAQSAKMSTEQFTDFYFDVCTMDYEKMSKAMDALVARMEATKEVRLVAKDTDLTFRIEGLPVVKCDGKLNIPDGEVFTAPVKDSVNGVITYNTPSLYMGKEYNNISLTFENGKIVKATANDTEGINKVFDTDEGARYVGEFAIGVNPYVLEPMLDTLFDEKIMGSIHFTPGSSYDNCYNGNKSAVHWDLVLIQTKAYGGGEIYFDGELIRKDGYFVPAELQCLNPENLK
ncbi:MAG: aminopeptidase [Eubacteriales bacterium]|nr:aminopeptidase [Eubacteriales bacterium]